MRSHPAQIVSVCLAVWTAGLASAQGPVHVRPAFVPAGDEITILDPGTNSEAKPAPILFDGPDGQPRIDIPPAVIVHNFYYSGDRDFRGPVFPGGPSIVVASHPITGERQYLEVQMLPGSPRVTYRKNYIDYDFGERSIRLRFYHPLKCTNRCLPTVAYNRGRNFVESTESKAVACSRHTKEWIDRTGIPHALGHVAEGAKGALNNSANLLHDVGAAVTAPVVRVAEATPIGGLFESAPEEQARRTRDIYVQKAVRANRLSELTIPTVR